MGLLARILGRVRSLFGGAESDEASPGPPTDGESTAAEPAADATGADAEPTVRRCPVCGTDVEPDGEACPLCGATELSSGTDSTDESESADTPGPETVATDGEETDDAADRLRELRDE